MKKAIVFGSSGQIGSYLYELLEQKDYDVTTVPKDILDLAQFEGDEDNPGFEMGRMCRIEKPDEIYFLAAKMYAPNSWAKPEEYMLVNGLSVLTMLNCIRKDSPATKFFLAGSAEVFDKGTVQQAEDTNRLPENPYGLSKMVAMEAVRIYREKYGIFACTGIFFNAESPRRKDTFFAKKVAKEVVRLKKELQDEATILSPIQLGKLEARRDWGWAPEYAEVAWKMLQLDTPFDLVIGTGEARTCREFVLECLKAAGLPDPEKHFNYYVKYEKVKEYTARDTMRACPELARKVLGWQAQYRFSDVARMLVESELSKQKEASTSGLTQTTK